MVRKPVAAGSFYAGTKTALEEQLRDCFLSSIGPGRLPGEVKEKRQVRGLVSPHAGYVYSGPIAAWAYLCLSEAPAPRTVVLIGPNHRGAGSPVATMDEGTWETPLGAVPVDEEVARQLIAAADGLLQADVRAHGGEHALEVQLPFLQFVLGADFRIVPISLADQRLETSRRLGEAIAGCTRGREDVLVLASTDLSHYQPQEVAEREDQRFIDAVLRADVSEVHSLASSLGATVCGYGGVIATIIATAAPTSGQIKLLQYATSAAATGETDAVVGYAACSIEPS